MKHSQMSIKWKIFGYFAAFVACILVLLWLFQTVFLESFYKMIKISSIKGMAQEICDNMYSDNLLTLLDKISQDDNMCIRIVDSRLEDIYSADIALDCVVHRLSKQGLLDYYLKAMENGGKELELFYQPKFVNKQYDDQFFTGIVAEPDTNTPQSLLYVQLVTLEDNSTAMVMLNTVVTPVGTTIETLRIQLLYITVIFLLISAIIALLLSRKIARPIVKINDSAKQLAKGDYDTEFVATGYREIEELNATLNYAAQELSKVEGLRRELIANMSHDLRTPLTMITGYGEVMRDIPGENSPENVQVIIDEAKRLTQLVNDIMDLSKIQSGNQQMSLERFDLTEEIQQIQQRYTKLMEQQEYDISFLYEDHAWVVADRIKISQVVYNLINNAINYTGEDKKVVVRQLIQGDKVRIEIQDTGPGIDPKDLPYIWDRYYKVDKTHKRAAVGSGIGLSIVKGILELHHAKYEVQSEVGKGSTFSFELNLAPDEEEKED